ncbi:MAG: SUMF1/EgtB/PvdO family nonheme iron enzyme [Kiritimatiellae bacterium]|nr:SUMF1/EgtB/PvdO family nonheme iron enzyme [Kiritimatiellia bacterium]
MKTNTFKPVFQRFFPQRVVVTMTAIVLLSEIPILSLAESAKGGWTKAVTEAFWNLQIAQSKRTETTPRLENVNEETAEGVLSTFGTQYMPRTYDRYQTARETAKERKALLAENFSTGKPSDATRGALFDKVSGAVAKSAAEMFRWHDVLCHYYLLHKAGVIASSQLSEIDDDGASVMLPSTKRNQLMLSGKTVDKADIKLSEEETTFAAKYMPRSHTQFKRGAAMLSAGQQTYTALLSAAQTIDAPRALIAPFRDQVDEIYGVLNVVTQTINECRLRYAVDDVTAEELASIDESLDRMLMKVLPMMEKTRYFNGWMRDNWMDAQWLSSAQDELGWKQAEMLARKVEKKVELPNGVVISFLPIPGNNWFSKYWFSRTEVTQAQWEAIMGANPAEFKSDDGDRAIETVSYKDCLEFVKRLNASVGCKEKLLFRIPTKEEWEIAAIAGNEKPSQYPGDIFGSVFKKVVTFSHSTSSTQSGHGYVPNSWGLYDMLGNVYEWTSSPNGEECFDEQTRESSRGDSYSVIGGSWESNFYEATTIPCRAVKATNKDNDIGLRLCLWETDSAIKTMTPVAKSLIADLVQIPGQKYMAGKHEVSQREWKTIMGAELDPSTFVGDDRPVEGVDWLDVRTFAEKLSSLPCVREAGLVFRLPTAEEWEVACRAGSDGDYCRLRDGSDISKQTLDRVAWFSDNSEAMTHPTGQKEPNAFGLHDMLGNVCEWTKTEWFTDEYVSSNEPQPHGYIVCGGGFGDFPDDCQSACRHPVGLDLQVSILGFRLFAEKIRTKKDPLPKRTTGKND